MSATDRCSCSRSRYYSLMSPESIEICEYSAEWICEFQKIGVSLRQALADSALRIDHIGSTSVPGLAAKSIIDVQVSVVSFDPMDSLLVPMTSLGYVWRQDNPEQTKRYFRERLGARRTHIHIRKLGSWHEQLSLLFRDYLRTHLETLNWYAQAKRDLATQFQNERSKYTAAKTPIIWEILGMADRWAAETGWEPGPTDA